MSVTSKHTPHRVVLGKTTPIYNGTVEGTGVYCQTFTVDDADSVLMSLYVKSLTSGTINVKIYTFTVTGEQKEIITFPEISAPTTELLLQKAALSLNNMLLEITHTGDAEISVYGKGLSAGQTSVVIDGATNARASQTDVSTTPIEVIPAALEARRGLILKNWSGGGTLYLGFTAAEAVLSNAWPVTLGNDVSMDVAAGQSVWAVADAGTIDVRIMEAGN